MKERHEMRGVLIVRIPDPNCWVAVQIVRYTVLYLGVGRKEAERDGEHGQLHVAHPDGHVRPLQAGLEKIR